MASLILQSNPRPILKWAGGKSKPFAQISQYFPKKYQRYIEPFLGGGAVFLSLSATGTKALLADKNPELIELYETVRDTPDALMEALEDLKTKYSEEFYYRHRSEKPTTKIERAARTLFLNKAGFNGLYRLNSKGEFNVPFGKRTKCPALYQKENFLAVSKKLKKALLVCMDFEKVLSKAKAGDFIYCDPPYEPVSSTSSFRSYTGEGFSQLDQARLEKAARQAAEKGATVVLSNSSVPFIHDLYKEWNLYSIKVKRPINSVGHKRGEIEEIVAVKQPL